MGVGRKKVVKQKARSSGIRKNILHGFLVYQYEMLQMPVEFAIIINQAPSYFSTLNENVIFLTQRLINLL